MPTLIIDRYEIVPCEIRKHMSVEQEGAETINHMHRATLTHAEHNQIMAIINLIQAAFLRDEIDSETYQAQRELVLRLAFSFWEN